LKDPPFDEVLHTSRAGVAY